MELDTSGWSGEGEFTQRLIEIIGGIQPVRFLKVEDAPTSRADSGFSFISNELFVVFASTERRLPGRKFGIIPVRRTIEEKLMDLAGLHASLSAMAEVGEADYEDQGMLQYLRTERILQPYQTRPYKQVELVRIYEGVTRPIEKGGNDRKTSG